MWLIVLLSILNACLATKFVNSEGMRIELGGLPINIFDLGLVVGFIWAFLPGGGAYVRTNGVSKPLLWTLVLFVVALILGSFSGMANADATSRGVITYARNFAMVAVMIVVGYRNTKNLTSGLIYCYVLILCGVAVACIIPFDFASASEALHENQNILSVRIVQYIANYAGLAGALLVFSLGMRGKGLLPRWMAILLAGLCVVGQCATLSRSDWAAVMAGLVVALAIMPTYSVGRKAITALIAVPVLFAFIVGGIFLAEKVSGREMLAKMENRFISMLPGDHEGIVSATATRVEGSKKELEFWSGSPIWGKGFAIQDSVILGEFGVAASGFRHNTWTSTLAETGLLGFAAMAMVCFGQMIMGWRMVRRGFDRRTVLVGAAAAITGAHFIIHGLCTMSFNTLRVAIPMAIMYGILLRIREIEKTMMAQYEGYLPEHEGLGERVAVKNTDGSLVEIDRWPEHAHF